MLNNISLFKLISSEFRNFVNVNTVDMMNTISHQIEDTVTNNRLPVDFYAGFQRYSLMHRQRDRYERLARVARRVFVFGVPDDEAPAIPGIEYIPLSEDDLLSQEWFLVVNTPTFFTALITREVSGRDSITGGRRFEGVWTYDEQVVNQADLLIAQFLGKDYLPIRTRDYKQQSEYVVSMAHDLITRLELSNVAYQNVQNVLGTLNKTAERMTQNQKIDTLLAETATTVLNNISARTVTIWEPRSETDEMEMVAAAGLPTNWRQAAYRRQPFGSEQLLAGQALAQEAVKSLPDLEREGEPDFFDPAARSIIAVPMQSQGRTVGVIQATSQRAHAFGRDIINMLQTVGTQLATSSLVEGKLGLAATSTTSTTSANTQAQSDLDWDTLEATLDGIIVLTPEKEVKFINQPARQLLDMSEQDLQGRNIATLNSPDLAEVVAKLNPRSRPTYRGIVPILGEEYQTNIAPIYPASEGDFKNTETVRYWMIVLRAQSVTPAQMPATNQPVLSDEAEQSLFTRMKSLNKLVSMLPSLGELSPTQSEAVNRISDLNYEIFDVLDKLQAQKSKGSPLHGGASLSTPAANGAQTPADTAFANDDASPKEKQLAQIEKGQLQNTAINFRELLQESVNNHEEEAASKGIKIQLEISSNIPEYLGDAEQISQAVSEMIDNAIKYCPEGAKVRVIAGVDNKHLIMAVRDNGKGVWLKDIPLLFDPHFRVNNAQTQAHPGEGLGLSLVKAVAENHGGRALVESRVGRGSIFFMKLPLEAQPV